MIAAFVTYCPATSLQQGRCTSARCPPLLRITHGSEKCQFTKESAAILLLPACLECTYHQSKCGIPSWCPLVYNGMSANADGDPTQMHANNALHKSQCPR
eukprot:6180382-Pleurochrysis_carterae.AAC.2